MKFKKNIADITNEVHTIFHSITNSAILNEDQISNKNSAKANSQATTLNNENKTYASVMSKNIKEVVKIAVTESIKSQHISKRNNCSIVF